MVTFSRVRKEEYKKTNSRLTLVKRGNLLVEQREYTLSILMLFCMPRPIVNVRKRMFFHFKIMH